MEREGASDRIEVHCEVTPEFMEQGGDIESSFPEMEKLSKEIGHAMKSTLGVSILLKVCKPHTIRAVEGKAIRVVDNRNNATAG